MYKQHISPVELEEALRQHGIESIAQIKIAILKIDGLLSVIPGNTPSYHSPRRVKKHRGPQPIL